MNGFNKYLAATFLSTAMLFTSGAQAMEIRQFDKMADRDQSDYINVLIDGAEKVLTDEGKPDQAAQVSHLFTTNDPGDEISIGMTEFIRNLAIVRANDAKHAIDHPNDPRLEVEDAMYLTLHLQKHPIDLPDSFFTVNKDFKPSQATDLYQIERLVAVHSLSDIFSMHPTCFWSLPLSRLFSDCFDGDG